MASLFGFLKSTILSKVVMALTGVLLVLYIIGHTAGNLQIYISRESFNAYSHFLHSTGELLWIVRIVLLVALLLHIITSIRLKLLNNYAKPDKYAVKHYVRAKLTSRTMLWTGIMIFAFVIYHLAHLTFGGVNPEQFNKPDYYEREAYAFSTSPSGQYVFDNNHYTLDEKGKVMFRRNDVYNAVVGGFKIPWISIIYIIGVIIVGFHLNHAIQSMFQTLGFNHPKYFPCIIRCSTVLSVVIVLCLISIPISIMLGLVGG